MSNNSITRTIPDVSTANIDHNIPAHRALLACQVRARRTCSFFLLSLLSEIQWLCTYVSFHNSCFLLEVLIFRIVMGILFRFIWLYCLKVTMPLWPKQNDIHRTCICILYMYCVGLVTHLTMFVIAPQHIILDYIVTRVINLTRGRPIIVFVLWSFWSSCELIQKWLAISSPGCYMNTSYFPELGIDNPEY